MPTIPVISMKNEPVGELELSDQIFGGRVNEHLIWEAVRQYRASQRSGTAKTKTRAEVSGAGRKLWRQKGTGRARIGSIRNPVWRGGGTVHGPVPRDYSYRMPKKAYRGALRSALMQKMAEGNFLVVEDVSIPEPKTRHVHQLLADLGVEKTGLFVTADVEPALELAVRNHPRAAARAADRLTPYEVARVEKLIVTTDAARKLEESYSR